MYEIGFLFKNKFTTRQTKDKGLHSNKQIQGNIYEYKYMKQRRRQGGGHVTLNKVNGIQDSTLRPEQG